MTQPDAISAVDLGKLRQVDSCTISNAIERLSVRLRNEGFISGVVPGGVQCQFPDLGPMAGYAATARIRTASAPMTQRCYYDRIDWWNYIASLPEPRVMVLQDVDPRPGVGAFVGEIHAAIARALGCAGCVTNGAVRDLPAVHAMGFPLFAGSVAVSHSYAHIIEFGEPVEIGGLKVQAGDLIHGDVHGVLSIPIAIARQLPAICATILQEERDLIRFCQSTQFSLQGLSERIGSRAPDDSVPLRSVR